MTDTNSIPPNSVNIYIGRNGSGKSQLLKMLCAGFLQRGEKVLAVAPTIFDRFKKMPRKGFRFYGARKGNNAAVEIIRDALTRSVSEDPQILKNLTSALRYTRFDPAIGIGVHGLNIGQFLLAIERARAGDRSDASRKLLAIAPLELEALQSTLLKWGDRFGRQGLTRITLDSRSFSELDMLSFAKLAQHEKLLRKTKAVSRIKYYLFRNSEQIELLEACSGELCFITTIAFIATQITPSVVIAIDEPETSLHPTWQQNYIQTLLDLFHRYQPRILISTHSPIIISAAEHSNGGLLRSELFVYQMNEGEPQEFHHAGLSLEAMYDKLFGLITPKNHYLSQRAVAILNDLNSESQSLESALHEIRELRSKSYDPRQKAILAKVENLARKVDARDGKEDDDELH